MLEVSTLKKGSYLLGSFGRYAAESLTVNNHPVILGGMVNRKDDHKVNYAIFKG